MSRRGILHLVDPSEPVQDTVQAPREPRTRRRLSKRAQHDESRAPSRLVSLRQAAGYLSVSYWTVRNWVETGKLSAIRLGPKLIRIERSDLDRFIGERKDAA
jgi:excisionase family DNA binding protein